jgi:hypothetical protein
MNVKLAKLSGGTTVISSEMLDGLKSRIRGTILTERDDCLHTPPGRWRRFKDMSIVA